MDRVTRLVKINPLAPLFGDMPIVFSSILKKSKNVDVSKWEYSRTDEALLGNYMLTKKVSKEREAYDAFMKKVGSVAALVS